MEAIIKSHMNDNIIQQAAILYGFDVHEITYVGGFENFVYAYHDYIIRFVHNHHRSYDYVLAEIEFIEYLSKHGASVSKIVHDQSDHIASKIIIDDDYYFTVSVFSKAPGSYVKKEMLTDDFLELFGESVGLLHQLTSTYPSNHNRYHWYEEDYLDMAKRNIPKEHAFVVDETKRIYDTIQSLERNKYHYALIHTDLHFGNMFYDPNQQKLTFFDFDDASYQFLISDLAIIIYYSFYMNEGPSETQYQRILAFMKSFMKGYHKHYALSKTDWMQLDLFLQLRQHVLVGVMYSAGTEFYMQPRIQAFLERTISQIKNHSSLIDVKRFIIDLNIE